jgi:hypothetical protein
VKSRLTAEERLLMARQEVSLKLEGVGAGPPINQCNYLSSMQNIMQQDIEALTLLFNYFRAAYHLVNPSNEGPV